MLCEQRSELQSDERAAEEADEGQEPDDEALTVTVQGEDEHQSDEGEID
jgi:hypothetical protein